MSRDVKDVGIQILHLSWNQNKNIIWQILFLIGTEILSKKSSMILYLESGNYIPESKYLQHLGNNFSWQAFIKWYTNANFDINATKNNSQRSNTHTYVIERHLSSLLRITDNYIPILFEASHTRCY